MNNLKRIKEVLDLDEWRKRQKTEFRKRLFSGFIAILLIIGVVYVWYYYG